MTPLSQGTETVAVNRTRPPTTPSDGVKVGKILVGQEEPGESTKPTVSEVQSLPQILKQKRREGSQDPAMKDDESPAENNAPADRPAEPAKQKESEKSPAPKQEMEVKIGASILLELGLAARVTPGDKKVGNTPSANTAKEDNTVAQAHAKAKASAANGAATLHAEPRVVQVLAKPVVVNGNAHKEDDRQCAESLVSVSSSGEKRGRGQHVADKPEMPKKARSDKEDWIPRCARVTEKCNAIQSVCEDPLLKSQILSCTTKKQECILRLLFLARAHGLIEKEHMSPRIFHPHSANGWLGFQIVQSRAGEFKAMLRETFDMPDDACAMSAEERKKLRKTMQTQIRRHCFVPSGTSRGKWEQAMEGKISFVYLAPSRNGGDDSGSLKCGDGMHEF